MNQTAVIIGGPHDGAEYQIRGDCKKLSVPMKSGKFARIDGRIQPLFGQIEYVRSGVRQDGKVEFR